MLTVKRCVDCHPELDEGYIRKGFDKLSLTLVAKEYD